MLSDLRPRSLVSFLLCSCVAATALAQEAPASPAAGMLRLLQSGRVPAERLDTILELICSRGTADDLAYVYQETLKPAAYPPRTRIAVLGHLASAARTRKVVPSGGLEGLAALLRGDDLQLAREAVELAGLWQVSSASDPLQNLATGDRTSDELRAAALGALARLGNAALRPAIDALLAESRPFSHRAAGIAALARVDLKDAAPRAAAALQQAGPDDDLTAILGAFLDRQGGPDELAGVLEGTPPSADTAKRLLRQMYAAGRSDAGLSAVLERAAGIQGDITPPTREELVQLTREVAESGDAARGEHVFRRADLSCLKCHAVSQAGGQIGPDLSALGSTSPVDYIINSIYDPDVQIKEAFHTKVVLTVDGLTLQGIVADRTGESLVLKDANGALQTIPLADIEEEIAGKSLMPKGLVKFMTRGELIDLVKFLSQLGKPGEYAIRTTPRMQRWRVLLSASKELIDDIPNEAAFEDQVLNGGQWGPAYARVNGALPLAELAAATKQPVLYVQGELNVSNAGPVGIRWEAPAGTHVWVGAEAFGAEHELSPELAAGRHKVTLRIPEADQPSAEARLELFRVEGSGAEFSVVDGQ